MAKNEIILGLGTNMGDRFDHLQTAIDQLSGFIEIEKISSVYESTPLDLEADTNFFNLCLSGSTDLTPDQVLSRSQRIEKEHGRLTKLNPDIYESRPLDIDILYYNDEIIETDELKIPHSQIHKRRFVLEPLREIIPNHVDPLRKLNIIDLANSSEDKSSVHKIDKQIRLNK